MPDPTKEYDELSDQVLAEKAQVRRDDQMLIYREKRPCVYAKQWSAPDPDSAASLERDSLGVLYSGCDEDGPFGTIQTPTASAVCSARVMRTVTVREGDWVILGVDHNRVMNSKDFEAHFDLVS